MAKKDLEDLPKDHPAQAASGLWVSLLLEPDMPGPVWVPETAKAEILKKLYLSHKGETKTLALAQNGKSRQKICLGIPRG